MLIRGPNLGGSGDLGVGGIPLAGGYLDGDARSGAAGFPDEAESFSSADSSGCGSEWAPPQVC